MEIGEGSDLFCCYYFFGMVLCDELLCCGWIYQICQCSDGLVQVFCYLDYVGEIGFIMLYEKDFCVICNWLCVLFVGKLYLCLFGEGGVDLCDLMVEDQQQVVFEVWIVEVLIYKKQIYFLYQGNIGIMQNLFYIGG